MLWMRPTAVVEMGDDPVPKKSVCFSLDPVEISRDRMIFFSEQFDPQPFHLDTSAAAGTLLNGLAASAWYLCAMIDEHLRRYAPANGLMVDDVTAAEQIVLLVPVRAGDRLVALVRPAEEESCRCGGRGAKVLVEVRNQKSQCVARMTLNCTIRMSHAESGGAFQACRFREGRPARAPRRNHINAIRFFEDIEIGDAIELGTYHFGPEEVADFIWRVAGEGCSTHYISDPCTVPAWHVPSAWMQCMVRYYDREARRLNESGRPVPELGPAAGIKHLCWHRPVRTGETIAFRGWAEKKLAIPSQKHWGLLVVGAEGLDETGDVVISFYPQMLLARTPRI